MSLFGPGLRLPLASGPLLLCVLAACGSSDPCEGESLQPCNPREPTWIERTFNSGTLSHDVKPREGYGGLKVRVSGDRSYVLEVTRDAELRPARRLVAYSRDANVLWTLQEQPAEHFSDFTVHPSGELTLGAERTDAQRGGYDLVRLSAAGEVLARAPIPETATLPEGDLGVDLPRQPFRMKSRTPHALTDGWLRTEARGEDLAVAFLTQVDEPDPLPGHSLELVTGVMTLGWSATERRYTEQWTRIVDGRHNVEPAAWAYDEFRWREAPFRPLLAVDEEGLVVGRTWNSLRCTSDAETFKQFPKMDCMIREDVTSPMDTEYQPFAFTAFSATGERSQTRSVLPALAAEFVVFDMAARGGQVALAGAIVRKNGRGGIDYYPSAPGAGDQMTPYDGYVGLFDRRTGAHGFSTFVGSERADHVSAVRWTEAGLVVVGASGWDRWAGGMSISRGAGPLLAFVATHGPYGTRTLPLDGGDRHFHLLGVDVRDTEVVAVGLAEAPMTHSGDGGQRANMTFGGLTVHLR